MRARVLEIALHCLALLLSASGCRQFEPPAPSPLAKPVMSPDSVALDIVFVQFPTAKAEQCETLWHSVDEQSLPLELRRELRQQGFRAGVIGSHTNPALDRLLGDQMGPSDQPDDAIVDFQPKEINVRKRHLQLRADHRSEIVVSGIYDQWPLLTRRNGEVTGRTYHQAQGIFALQTHPLGDGRVRVELSPELHHGSPKRQYTVNEGAWVLDSGRPREVFDALRIAAVLSPGEMLLVGQTADAKGSVGARFFNVDDTPTGVAAQRLLFIRLAQTQYDDRFSPPLP